MPRKKYEYTPVENVKTLRLSVNFGKLSLLDIVDEAYYILSTKEKKKASYVLKAIMHYDESEGKNKSLQRTLQRIRVAGVAKKLFEINTEEDARRLLSLSTDSREYKALVRSIPEYTTPTSVLFGFKIGDVLSEQLHTRLFNMSVNERIMLISNAVVEYVLDGLDPELDKIFATKFLVNSINEYNDSPNKDIVLNNFLLMINFPD